MTMSLHNAGTSGAFLVTGIVITAWMFGVPGSNGGTPGVTAPPTATNKVPVILIVVESLRADHTGHCYGYHRNTTPHICSIASDGIVFEQAYAHGSWDPTAIPSLLTGMHPATVAPEGNTPMTRAVPTLIDTLADRGYKTRFTRKYPNPVVRSLNVTRRHSSIPSLPPQPSTFLLWLLQDTHYPYIADPGYRIWANVSNRTYKQLQQEARKGWEQVDLQQLHEDIGTERYTAMYDEELRQVNHRIGRFLTALRAAGMYREALIIVTGDHGERIGTFGLKHTGWPDRAVTNVPLIIKLPGNKHAGNRVTQQVRHIDIAPTIHDLLGIDRTRMDGESLLPLLRNNTGRPVAAGHSPRSRWTFRAGEHVLYVERPKTVCRNGTGYSALYQQDVAVDERQDRSSRRPEVATQLRTMFCRTYLSALSARPSTGLAWNSSQ